MDGNRLIFKTEASVRMFPLVPSWRSSRLGSEFTSYDILQNLLALAIRFAKHPFIFPDSTNPKSEILNLKF